jgi:hypothetical protein
MNLMQAHDAPSILKPEFILPAGYDAREYLPAKEHRYSDQSDHLLNVIVRKMLARKVDANGYSRLRCETLREQVSKRKLKPFLTALEDGQVIVRDKSYSVGRYSMGYALHPRMLRQRHRRVKPSCPWMQAKLVAMLETMAAQQRERRAEHLPL